MTMTPERKDEIWAMLPNDFKDDVRQYYKQDYSCPTVEELRLMEHLFGLHNLTAQAEEKPKEPKYKRGDKVVIYGLLAVVFNAHEHGYDVVFQGDHKFFNLPESSLEPYTAPKEEHDENSVSSCLKRINPTENGISDSKIQSESAESVETSTNSQTNSQAVNHIPDSTKKVDYAQYRLDLAKEIAVAMIAEHRATYDLVGYRAVYAANDIVKRLKETEDAD